MRKVKTSPRRGYIFVFDESVFSLHLLSAMLKICRSNPKIRIWIIISKTWLPSVQKLVNSRKLKSQIKFIPSEPDCLWPWLKDLAFISPCNKLQLLKIKRATAISNRKITETTKLLASVFQNVVTKSVNLGIEGGDVLFFQKQYFLGKESKFSNFSKNLRHLNKRLFHLDLSLALLRSPKGQTIALMTDRLGKNPSKSWTSNRRILQTSGVDKVIRVPSPHHENLYKPWLNLVQIDNHLLIPAYKGQKRMLTPLLKEGFQIHNISCDALSKRKGAVRCRILDIPLRSHS